MLRWAMARHLLRRCSDLTGPGMALGAYASLTEPGLGKMLSPWVANLTSLLLVHKGSHETFAVSVSWCALQSSLLHASSCKV